MRTGRSPASFRVQTVESEFFETLHESVLNGLRQVIGESGIRALLFNIELGQYLDEPEAFHRNLYAIFNEGAIILEKVIVKELFRRINMPYTVGGDFDFARCVSQARNFHGKTKKIKL
jgi:hypothetical protein